MPEQGEALKKGKFENAIPLRCDTLVDEFPVPVSTLKGNQTETWDLELLRAFVPLNPLKPRHSEADIFQSAIAEGTAYVLYQKLKETGDSKVKSRWLFLQLQQSYYLNLAQNIIWIEQFLEEFPSLTKGFQTILLKGYHTRTAPSPCRHPGF